jgi:tRNA(adenine34) deaminase
VVDEKDVAPAAEAGALDEGFMRLALDEARAAAAEDEVPIGAVVVCDGRVVARAHNRRELDEDPSAHAEFKAMVDASRALGRWRLTGCAVYVTLEPCLMCAGLMVNARVDRCVYGAPDPKGGALGTLYDVSHDPRLNHEFQVTSGVLQGECALVLREFFRAKRAARKAAARVAGARVADAGDAGRDSSAGEQ